MSLRELANTLIQSRQLPAEDGKLLFKYLQQTFISAELKPFISYPPSEENSLYYEKYKRLDLENTDQEFYENGIPDFFSHNGDFYDLNTISYCSIERDGFKIFSAFFLLKLLQIESENLSIADFLDFQLYDNFYGNKEQLSGFLYQLLSNTGNYHLLPETTGNIYQWILKNVPENNTASYDFSNELTDSNNLLIADENDINDLSAEPESLSAISNEKENTDFKIEGNFTNDEIKKFFSFLYLEKSCDKKPFLKEEEVIDILKNGLVIPATPPSKKYKLNCDPKFPRKIIDYAIHLFYTKHSLTRQNKSDFILFFGCYLDDYKDALIPNKLKMLTLNIRGMKSPRGKINFNKYLPDSHQL